MEIFITLKKCNYKKVGRSVLVSFIMDDMRKMLRPKPITLCKSLIVSKKINIPML